MINDFNQKYQYVLNSDYNIFIENSNIEIPINMSSSLSNVFSVTNDSIVNDFINQNISLESLIEKELYRTNL